MKTHKLQTILINLQANNKNKIKIYKMSKIIAHP